MKVHHSFLFLLRVVFQSNIVILISIFTTSPHKIQAPIGNKFISELKIDLRGNLRDDYWIETQQEEQKEKKGV
jgi:hypothetical protein